MDGMFRLPYRTRADAGVMGREMAGDGTAFDSRPSISCMSGL